MEAIWTWVNIWTSKQFQPYLYLLFVIFTFGSADFNYMDFDTRIMNNHAAAFSFTIDLLILPYLIIQSWVVFLFTWPLYIALGIFQIIDWSFREI